MEKEMGTAVTDNIVITGMGVVSALGIGINENYKSLSSGINGIKQIRFLNTSHKETMVGEVKLSSHDLRASVGLATEGDLSRTTSMAVACVWEALKSAKIEDPKIIRIITGTTVGGTDLTDDCYFKLQCDKKQTKYVRHHAINYCNDSIAYYAKSKKTPITISTACSSALNSIILGVRLLQMGKEKFVIAGGSEAFSKFHFNGFRSLKIMDSKICHPFGSDAQGLNLGEGAAYFVLEREKDAIRRGAEIFAYINGWGNSCDTAYNIIASEKGEGAFNAMKSAIENAALKPEEIDYINAHGTGIYDNDKSELMAIRNLFGRKIPNISSTKSYTGHTISASGALSVAFSVLSIKKQFIAEDIRIKESLLPIREKREIHNVLCNAFGFGGNDSSIVISDHPTQNTTEIENGINFKFASDIYIDEEEKLRLIDNFIPSNLSRKMCRLQKAAAITAVAACREAKIEKPDAIIVSTKMGMLENREKQLLEMTKNGEDAISPTIFMQSLYSTLASTIAMVTKCSGYNITYAEDGFDRALEDGKMLITEGRANKVLIGCYEESTEIYRNIIESLNHTRRAKENKPLRISARSIILERDV